MNAAVGQCTARSKQTGERCKRRMRGGGVCRYHGGAAPQVRARRAERLVLAEALANDPARPPAEVLLDVAHQADFLLRRARAEVDVNRPTAKTMAQLLEFTQTAGQWAKVTLDAGTAERQTRVLEVQAQLLYRVIAEAVATAVPDEAAQVRVLSLVADGLRAQGLAELEAAL